MYRKALWFIVGFFGIVFITIASGWASQQEETRSDLSSYDPRALAFVTNRDSQDVAVIDTKTDQIVGRISLGEFANAHMAMLTPDGKKLLVSATGQDKFLVVDLATQKVERSVATGKGPEHFDLTKDGGLVYLGNMEDSTVSVIDLGRGEEVRRIAGFAEPHGFSVLPDRSKVYVSNFGAHELGVVDIPSQQLAHRLPVGDVHRASIKKPQRYQAELKGIANPTLTLDGRFVYAADGDAGEVDVIDTRSDRTVASIKVGTAPWRAYAAPDGRWMLVPNNGDGTVSVINTRTHKVQATLPAGRDMTGINFLQGGQKAYIVSRGEGTVFVYDLDRFKMLHRLKLGEAASLETAATAADGTKIYLASSSENTVYIIDGRTDQVKEIPGIGQYPWGVTILGAASPNYCH